MTQYGHEKGKKEDVETGIGTGVVISDTGTILTNLHVVGGADKVMVKFYNGLESEANVTGVRPELDLAVLEPKTIPDDLKPATLRSTKGLHMGDKVIAVGHPFGIGKSVSAGVISGFRREYKQGRQGSEQERADPEPYPVRRRRESGEFRRSVDDDGRRRGRHRHGDLQSQQGRPHLCRHRLCRSDRVCGGRGGRIAILDGHIA